MAEHESANAPSKAIKSILIRKLAIERNLPTIKNNCKNIRPESNSIDSDVRPYFETWKSVFVRQVKYEMECQIGACTIFTVLETKITLQKNKAFTELFMILKHRQYLPEIKQRFMKGFKMMHSLKKRMKKKAL